MQTINYFGMTRVIRLSISKRIGRFWSVRVGIGYRALAVDDPDGPIWFGLVHMRNITGF